MNCWEALANKAENQIFGLSALTCAIVFSRNMVARVKALFVFILLWTTQNTVAQQTMPQTVDFECIGCTPADALVKLSRQTGVNIVFSDRFFESCESQDFRLNGTPFLTVVEKISNCARVAYKVLDNQIVFFRKTSRFTLSGYIQDAVNGERLLGATVKSVSEKELAPSAMSSAFSVSNWKKASKK